MLDIKELNRCWFNNRYTLARSKELQVLFQLALVYVLYTVTLLKTQMMVNTLEEGFTPFKISNTDFVSGPEAASAIQTSCTD